MQAEALDQLLELKNISINLMLALHVTEAELVKRLLKRGETSDRPDDNNEQVIRTRIHEYHKKTSPVADHYKKKDKVIMVKGEGSVNDIFSALSKEIDSRIKGKKS